MTERDSQPAAGRESGPGPEGQADLVTVEPDEEQGDAAHAQTDANKATDIEPPSRVEALIGRVFERVGMVVVSLFVFFLLAECITRVVDRIVNDVPVFGADERNVLYMEHPFMYRVPRPTARFGVYEVNAQGFRGREFKMPKPPSVFRILTLGGSAAWDTDVSSTRATWAAQLEDRLNEKRGSGSVRFEVVNGGVPGYNSAESLMNFIWRGLAIQPDAVIVYQGYNDFKPNRIPGFKSDYSHFRSRDHTTLSLLAQRSRFLFYFHKLIGRLSAYRGRTFDTVTEPGIRAFKENLRRIVLLARDKGVKPVLSTYAMSVTLENKRRHPERFKGLRKYLPTLSFKGVMDAHRRYNDAVRELALESNVALADIDSAVPKTFVYFRDHCHFTDKGSALAARKFTEVILRRIFVPGKTGRPASPRSPAPAARPSRDAASAPRQENAVPGT